MKIRLVAIDMDGTLLNSQKQLSAENCAAIKKANAQGVKIVLATGRPITGIKPFLEQADLWHPGQYSITLNGATVVENGTAKCLDHFSLSYVAYRIFSDYAKKHGYGIQIQDNEALYTTDKVIAPQTIHESKTTFQPIRQVDRDYIMHLGYIHKLQLLGEPPLMDEAIAGIAPDLKKIYQVIRQVRYGVDVMSLEAGKGNGLIGMSSKLGIPLAQTMALGDGGNDVSILRNAGLGVAMANAVPAAKAAADVMTASNDENGVAQAISKYVLK